MMNGILTTNFRAGPDSIDVYCGRLEVALRELKFRLQAQYERRFPGEAMRIREAISQAEIGGMADRLSAFVSSGFGGGSDCPAVIFLKIGA